jgi:hypothetical protein
MYRDGRPREPVFSPQELLFRRYSSEHWVDGKFVAVGFKFPKQSVNRERFSQPEDVLFSDSGEFNGWGVLEFHVSDVPLHISFAQGLVSFFVKHSPYDDNYAHSEIWSDKDNSSGESLDLSSAVKKQFRTILAQRVKVRIEAAV